MTQRFRIQAIGGLTLGLLWGVLGAEAQTLPTGVREFVPPPVLQNRELFFLERLDQGWELLVRWDSRRNEPLQTTLWRWEGNSATLLATIPGMSIKYASFLESGRNGVRRLFAFGELSCPEGVNPRCRTPGYMVVDLPTGSAPRTVWRSIDIEGTRDSAPHAADVNPGGTRWAVLLLRREGPGAVVLVGELPSTRPSYRLEWIPSGGPEFEKVLLEFAENSDLYFLDDNRILVMASDVPMLVEIQGNQLRRTLLGVPVPAGSFRYQESTRTLWIADRTKMDSYAAADDPRKYYGFVLPEAGSGLLGDTLSPSFQYSIEQLGLASYPSRQLWGFLSNSVPVFLVRSNRQKELVSVRLDGPQGPQVVERKPVPTNLGTTVSLGLQDMITKQSRRTSDGRTEIVYYRIDLTRYRSGS